MIPNIPLSSNSPYYSQEGAIYIPERSIQYIRFVAFLSKNKNKYKENNYHSANLHSKPNRSHRPRLLEHFLKCIHHLPLKLKEYWNFWQIWHILHVLFSYNDIYFRKNLIEQPLIDRLKQPNLSPDRLSPPHCITIAFGRNLFMISLTTFFENYPLKHLLKKKNTVLKIVVKDSSSTPWLSGKFTAW